MTVLITGVAGHIGSRLARYALDRGSAVIGMDDLSCGYRESAPKEVEFHLRDCCERWPDLDVDVVFHCAAYAAEVMSPHVRAYNYYNNLVATARAVNFCVRRNARLVYFSSAAVYGAGFLSEPPFDERDICHPHDPYGVAKLAAERDVAIAGEQHGLEYVILRPHNVYGSGQSIWQRYRNVMGIWLARCFQGLPVTIFGDGEQRRAFSHVDDVIPCVWRAGTTKAAVGEIVNLGGAKPTRINELASLFCTMFGCGLERLPARHEVVDTWCTTEKSERLLGYRETVSLAAGVEEFHAWALEAWSKYLERRVAPRVGWGVELADGMPESWKEDLQ